MNSVEPAFNEHMFKEKLFNIGIEEIDQKDYLKVMKSIPSDYKYKLSDFILNRTKEGKRIKTIESYIIDLKQLIKYLELKEKEIDQLEDGDIERYKNYLLKHGLKAKSINRKLASINQFLKYIGSQVKFKKIKEQRNNFLNDVLTKEEIEKLLKSCKDNIRNRTIMFTLYKTGLRVSELLKLTISDANKKAIDIEGKGGKYRKIPIPKSVKESWNDYLKVRIRDDSNKLFIGTQGPLKRSSINSIIKKHAGIAKVKKEKAHPHNFRHAFCKALVENGVPIETIADLAGHSSLETTRIYTTKTEKELRDILDDM